MARPYPPLTHSPSSTRAVLTSPTYRPVSFRCSFSRRFSLQGVKRALEIAIGMKTGSTSTDALAAAVRFKSFRASDLEIKATELSGVPEAESRAAMLVVSG